MNLFELLGSSPRLKVMQLFLNNPDEKFNKSEISRLTKGVSRTTLQTLCDDLIKINFIAKEGNYYRLRRSDPFVKIIKERCLNDF